jgi:hypothetical protein
MTTVKQTQNAPERISPFRHVGPVRKVTINGNAADRLSEHTDQAHNNHKNHSHLTLIAKPRLCGISQRLTEKSLVRMKKQQKKNKKKEKKLISKLLVDGQPCQQTTTTQAGAFPWKLPPVCMAATTTCRNVPFLLVMIRKPIGDSHLSSDGVCR